MVAVRRNADSEADAAKRTAVIFAGNYAATADYFLSYPENYPLGSALALIVMLLTSVGVWFTLRAGEERSAR